MTEQSGVARALEVLGNEIIKTETQLSMEKALHDDANKRLIDLLVKNKELTEQLEQARAAEEAASSYALKLERLLEECRKVYKGLTDGEPEPPKEGGAEDCKKS